MVLRNNLIYAQIGILLVKAMPQDALCDLVDQLVTAEDRPQQFTDNDVKRAERLLNAIIAAEPSIPEIAMNR